MVIYAVIFIVTYTLSLIVISDTHKKNLRDSGNTNAENNKIHSLYTGRRQFIALIIAVVLTLLAYWFWQ